MDWGSLAGGIASGMDAGSNIYARQQYANMTREQLDQLKAQSAGQNAYFNMFAPGAQPLPQAAIKGVDNFQLPAMAQQPAGPAPGPNAWPQPPLPPGMPPMPQHNQMLSGPNVQGSPIQQPQTYGMPQLPQAQPTGRSEGGQPIESVQAMPVTPQAIATAIDQANPGLRQSNPRAFTAAVQYGMQQMQQMQGMQQGGQLNQAKIAEMQSRAAMEQGHGQYYQNRSSIDSSANKINKDMYDQNQRAIRHAESEKTKLMNSFMHTPQHDAAIKAYDKQLVALHAQEDRLVRRMQGLPITEESVQRELSGPMQFPSNWLDEAKNWDSKTLQDKLRAMRRAKISDGTIDAFMKAIGK